MQLQDSLARFRAAGIGVFAISTDSVEELAAFAEQRGITYPLLSDSRSETIQRYGILNTLIGEGEPEFGIPFPGSYLVGPDGRVIEKSFHREYQVRDAPPTVLRSGFGAGRGAGISVQDMSAGGPVTIAITAGASSLGFMERAEIEVSLELHPGIHIYGRPIPDGYEALDVRVEAPEGVRAAEAQYPATRPFRIAGLDEEFHVYEGRVAVRVPIILAIRPSETLRELHLAISTRYQACTDRECYPPARHATRLIIPLAG